jgi:hypothetical protein
VVYRCRKIIGSDTICRLTWSAEGNRDARVGGHENRKLATAGRVMATIILSCRYGQIKW